MLVIVTIAVATSRFITSGIVRVWVWVRVSFLYLELNLMKQRYH